MKRGWPKCPACGRLLIGINRLTNELTCGYHYVKQDEGETFVLFPQSGNWILADRLKVEPAPEASPVAFW